MHPSYVHGFFSSDPIERVRWAQVISQARAEAFREQLDRMRAEKGHALTREDIQAAMVTASCGEKKMFKLIKGA